MIEQELVILEQSIEFTQYTICLSPFLLHKLELFLSGLKKLGMPNNTKQAWLTLALKEKLALEELSPNVSKACHLNIRLNSEINKRIQDRVDYIRQFRSNYSKKQLILDAIEEKIELEREMVQKKFQEYLADSQN